MTANRKIGGFAKRHWPEWRTARDLGRRRPAIEKVRNGSEKLAGLVQMAFLT